jgi:hypothetical protein
MPLAVALGTASQQVSVDLCYQMSGGAITNFTGFSYSDVYVTSDRSLYTVTASKAPGAGTWTVGACVHNFNAAALSNNDYVNGWMMVTN